jgi:hypothetical protein
MPTQDEKPLTREGLRMVSEFRKYRDIYRAAEKAKVPKNQAIKLFNSTVFQDELDRQEEAVRQERAKLEAKAESLTREFLDGELTKLIKKDQSLEALRLGYVVVGAVQDKNLRSSAPSTEEPSSNTGPTFIYRATVEGTVSQAVEPIVAETPAATPEPIVPAATTPPPAHRLGPLKIG